MKLNSETTLWIVFAAVSLLTWLVGELLIFTSWYYPLVKLLGVTAVVVALLTLRVARRKGWATIGVVAGLLIGQLWFVKRAAKYILWSIGGFV